jgi:hypothetical protein
MCQEYHDRYACDPRHTVFKAIKQPCAHPNRCGLFHQKFVIIQNIIPYVCSECARKSVVVLPQPTVYTVPTVIRPAAVCIQPVAQPANIILQLNRLPVPTLLQQTPGPGSGGAPLTIPAGTGVENRVEWSKSKGCYVTVTHYTKAPQAVVSGQASGYNTIHGADPGPPPPGFGARPNPFPAGRTGYSTTHGADPGAPPPGSKSHFSFSHFVAERVSFLNHVSRSDRIQSGLVVLENTDADICSGRNGSSFDSSSCSNGFRCSCSCPRTSFRYSPNSSSDSATTTNSVPA